MSSKYSNLHFSDYLGGTSSKNSGSNGSGSGKNYGSYGSGSGSNGSGSGKGSGSNGSGSGGSGSNYDHKSHDYDWSDDCWD